MEIEILRNYVAIHQFYVIVHGVLLVVFIVNLKYKNKIVELFYYVLMIMTVTQQAILATAEHRVKFIILIVGLLVIGMFRIVYYQKYKRIL